MGWFRGVDSAGDVRYINLDYVDSVTIDEIGFEGLRKLHAKVFLVAKLSPVVFTDPGEVTRLLEILENPSKQVENIPNTLKYRGGITS